MRNRRSAVLGGSGFIGRYVVQRLAARGDVIAVGCRRAEDARFLKPKGDVGQVAASTSRSTTRRCCRPFSPATTRWSIASASCTSAARRDSMWCITSAPARLARLAREAGIERLVHVSAIGADPRSASAYARSKAAGEAGGARRVPDRDDPAPVGRVRPGGPVLQPLRGDGDDLAGRAADRRRRDAVPAGLCRRRRGGGGPRASTIRRPPGAPTSSAGPKIYTFRELMELMLEEIKPQAPLRRPAVRPRRLQARLLSLLPKPPLTPDQVEMLKRDNVVSSGRAEHGGARHRRRPRSRRSCRPISTVSAAAAGTSGEPEPLSRRRRFG